MGHGHNWVTSHLPSDSELGSSTWSDVNPSLSCQWVTAVTVGPDVPEYLDDHPDDDAPGPASAGHPSTVRHGESAGAVGKLTRTHHQWLLRMIIMIESEPQLEIMSESSSPSGLSDCRWASWWRWTSSWLSAIMMRCEVSIQSDNDDQRL